LIDPKTCAGLAAVAMSLLAAVPANAKPVESKMVDAANRFLAALKDEQKAKATFPFDSEERFNWFFTPVPRKGLTMKEMTEPQKKAALDLLRTGLSVKGYQKAETIRQLESVLKEVEQGKGPDRDPINYFVSIFGTPTEKGVWGWRWEGHHQSFNWTFIDGKVIASTPQFLGSNPAEVRVEHKMKGTRVLAAEEDLARALVKSLETSQKGEAVISEKAPADILTSNQRQAAIQEDRGVAYGKLTSEQKGMLMALIHEVAEVQAPELSKARIQRLTKAGLDSVKFAWMGGLDRGQPHYYRVQGKTFLIEYDNTQNDANHVHCVWRDFNGDFGRDLLAEHYKSAPNNHGHNIDYGYDPHHNH
jgi:hypothetical protein